tara:strand:- start:2345 stop:3376 length:1032 start_codon:yes stop_codon:yes gene_type:complete
MQVKFYQDDQRLHFDQAHQRPVTTHLFYPTQARTHKKILSTKMFHFGEVIPDALYAQDHKRPLILVSHGSGGVASQMLWLVEKLVEQGYIVAALNHHGNTGFEPKGYQEGYDLWWERAQDLHVVLDKLSQERFWSQQIDFNRVGLLGFSLGGYTVLSGAGAITDNKRLHTFCQAHPKDGNCQSYIETSDKEKAEVATHKTYHQAMQTMSKDYTLPHLKAVVALSPAVVPAFTIQSLKRIQTPIQLIVGSKDRITLPEFNASLAHQYLSNSQLYTLPEVNHFAFLALCTKVGKMFFSLNSHAGNLCYSPQGVERQQVHNQAVSKTLSFFSQYLPVQYKSVNKTS